MVRIDQAEDYAALVAGPVQLTFRWDGNRWSHELSAHGRPLAASFEMEPGRDDPACILSPSYQYLSHQLVAGGAQALLVGQWGTSHCSGVFTADETDGCVSIGVDVAVRSRDQARAVAATYLVQRSSGELREAGPSAAAWDDDDNAASVLTLEVRRPGVLGLAEGAGRACRVQVGQETPDASSTQRFYYCWRWYDAAGDR